MEVLAYILERYLWETFFTYFKLRSLISQLFYLQVLGRDTEEFKRIEDYTKNTHAKTHDQYDLEIMEVSGKSWSYAENLAYLGLCFLRFVQIPDISPEC